LAFFQSQVTRLYLHGPAIKCRTPTITSREFALRHVNRTHCVQLPRRRVLAMYGDLGTKLVNSFKNGTPNHPSTDRHCPRSSTPNAPKPSLPCRHTRPTSSATSSAKSAPSTRMLIHCLLPLPGRSTPAPNRRSPARCSSTTCP